MVLGLLYNRLPGRIGPLRAASLASVWFAAAATGEIASRWFGVDSGRTWAFPGLQLLLFMTVVSVVYDYRTVLAAGGGRAEFELVYGVARTRDLLAIAAPALIAILAISQQLATGEGLDSIQGIVESLPSIVPAGR